MKPNVGVRIGVVEIEKLALLGSTLFVLLGSILLALLLGLLSFKESTDLCNFMIM